MEKLRQYLIDNYNMQNHRNTEDFAIEMLKTSHANYLEASKRAMITLQINEIKRKFQWFKDSIDHMQTATSFAKGSVEEIEKLLSLESLPK